MKLGGVLVYVKDVAATIALWERAFGLERKMIVEGGLYGELQATVPIGFVDEAFAAKGVGGTQLVPNRAGGPAASIEIALTTDDVDASFARAVEAGCSAIAPPHDKPWGQRVSYVRVPDGVLVEICTPW